MEKLIDEYIAKRCESILSNSDEYKQAEKMENDSAIVQGIAETEIYKNAFIDGMKFYTNISKKM